MIKMSEDIKKLYFEILEHITHTNKPIRVEIEHQGRAKEFYVWQKRINGLIYIAVQGASKLTIYSLSKKTRKMEFVTEEYYSTLKKQGRDIKTGWVL